MDKRLSDTVIIVRNFRAKQTRELLTDIINSVRYFLQLSIDRVIVPYGKELQKGRTMSSTKFSTVVMRVDNFLMGDMTETTVLVDYAEELRDATQCQETMLKL